MLQYAGLYIFTDANVSAVYTKCNVSQGEYPCKDGLSCYTHKQMCDGIAACSRDHRDEMGCQLNQGRILCMPIRIGTKTARESQF